jgi:hypothetical protein
MSLAPEAALPVASPRLFPVTPPLWPRIKSLSCAPPGGLQEVSAITTALAAKSQIRGARIGFFIILIRDPSVNAS